jgi:ParB family chromosome partitioning protein
MKLAFADPRNLSLSPLNMHFGRPDPDVSDILPSVRSRGVLLTLLVLPCVVDGVVQPDRFEVVAGRRRWKAALAALEAGVEIDPVPIGILEPGDDAGALEASLIENLGRLPPDEVTCWETFSRLIKAGRTAQEIATTFGLSDTVVKRTLALGGLLPRIRNLYRNEQIDVATVRQLTLATKAQQKAWLALLDDPQQHAPMGTQLKSWLFGGASIPVSHARFPPEFYTGGIVADLFGEESYYADTEQFWRLQNEAIAVDVECLQGEGWSEVTVLPVGERFTTWTHEKVGKRAGGKVFIEVSPRGEVTVHEGWLTTKEARKARAAAERAARGEAGDEPQTVRAEVTKAQEAYLELHRLAAVRVALTEHPQGALRLMVAHAIAGGLHWRVEAETRRGEAGVMQSLAASPATTAFAQARRSAAARLGFDDADRSLVRRRVEGGVAAVFARLLTLDDADVLTIAAVVMAESLAAGGVETEAAGAWLGVDLGRFWSPDDTFFDLIRDREAVNALLREVGGRKVADGNLTETVKVQKQILRDCLTGANDRPKVEGWVPRWLAFPASSYTRRPFGPEVRGRAAARLLRDVLPREETAPEADIDPAAIAAE